MRVPFKRGFLKYITITIKTLFSKNRYSKTIFVKELRRGNSVFLKTPTNIPQKILDDFSVLFEKYPAILFAYLAEGFLEVNEPAHYIVGVKLDPKFNLKIEQLIELMAKEFNEIIPKGFYVDIIGIHDIDAPINNFMKDYLIPFYTREKQGVKSRK